MRRGELVAKGWFKVDVLKSPSSEPIASGMVPGRCLSPLDQPPQAAPAKQQRSGQENQVYVARASFNADLPQQLSVNKGGKFIVTQKDKTWCEAELVGGCTSTKKRGWVPLRILQPV